MCVRKCYVCTTHTVSVTSTHDIQNEHTCSTRPTVYIKVIPPSHLPYPLTPLLSEWSPAENTQTTCNDLYVLSRSTYLHTCKCCWGRGKR